jgi:NADH:ubiquinone oxidoreductase subunit 4 (subunit M)
VQLWDWLITLVQPIVIILFPFWLGPRRKITRRVATCSGTAAVLLLIVAIGGYAFHWEWTGFADQKLWDWIEKFFIAFAVPIALIMLDKEQLKSGSHDDGRSSQT